MAPSELAVRLQSFPELYVRQKRELGELFGIETRNKYAISTPERQEVAYAAEQQKGLLGMLLRQVMGHWRTFDIMFFDPARTPAFRAHHPFRFFFQRLEIFSSDEKFVGALQQRLGRASPRNSTWKDASGRVVFEMRSGLLKMWTFPFLRNGREEAVIEKKWSGALTELFTDKDNFRVRFINPQLTADERTLILAAAIFVDLQYFENKANQE